MVIEDTPTVFGYQHRGGHATIHYDRVRVPAENLLGSGGIGLRHRPGPGWDRAYPPLHAGHRGGRAVLCDDGEPGQGADRLPEDRGLPGRVREWIAESRMRIEQARLLVLKTAWMIDKVGVKAARVEISAIKVVAPETLCYVSDRAIQVFGGAGFTDHYPLASFYAMGRWLQMADGPDEVHRRSVARAEIGRFDPGYVPEPYVWD